MTKEFDKEKAEEELKRKAAEVGAVDVDQVLDSRELIEEKAKSVPGSLRKMVNQIRLLFELISDYRSGAYRKLPWVSIAMAVAALIYFISPLDLIPDFIPGLGYVDDAFVIAAAISAIREDLRLFCDYKNYDPEQYF